MMDRRVVHRPACTGWPRGRCQTMVVMGEAVVVVVPVVAITSIREACHRSVVVTAMRTVADRWTHLIYNDLHRRFREGRRRSVTLTRIRSP